MLVSLRSYLCTGAEVTMTERHMLLPKLSSVVQENCTDQAEQSVSLHLLPFFLGLTCFIHQFLQRVCVRELDWMKTDLELFKQGRDTNVNNEVETTDSTAEARARCRPPVRYGSA